MVISPLILWLVARALRARCDTQGRSTHHDDDTPPLHPHIKIEITKFDENTAQNENTGLSRELRQRQYNSDQCDRATVRVYDNGDGIPDAEAALRYVAKSIALYTLAVSDTTSETAVTTYYVDQGTFELETTCHDEAVIRSYRLERALVQLVPGPVRVKPPSLHFSGTRVSFVVISSQNLHVQNEHSRFQLAEFIHSQCQNIQRMVSPLLGVPATLTVIPNLGFHETLLGRRMMLGKGESTCCSYHASAVALVSIPHSSTSVDRPESIGANTPSDSKHRPVPIYILTNCNGRPTTFALDSIGTAVVTVLSEKIDWDSYGFALRKTSSCPLKLSEAGGGEAYDCVQCTSLPIGPVQPESQCAVDAIAVRVVVRTKGKVNPITSKRLITSVKKAVDETLLDIKSSCPTAAMADGRERSIARAVPIISRSLLTSILGRSAQKKFSSEEEFQTRIFNLLSMALDENKNNKKARVEINY